MIKNVVIKNVVISNLLKKNKLKGSLTIEASVVTLVFLFSVISIGGFLNVINVQQNIRICLENTSRRMAQTIYYKEQITEMGNEIEVANEIEKLIDSRTELFSEDDKTELLETVSKAALDIYVYGSFVDEMEGVNDTCIVGGMAGLNFTETEYDSESGELHIVLKYMIKLPYISEKIFYMSDRQNVCVKVWNGKDITKVQNMIYITKNGKVYHTSKECTHLNISVSKTTYGRVEELRNSTGSKYRKCNLCKFVKNEKNMIVFITDYGERYHSTLECSGLSRGVIAIDEADIGERRLCKSCEEGIK